MCCSSQLYCGSPGGVARMWLFRCRWRHKQHIRSHRTARNKSESEPELNSELFKGNESDVNTYISFHHAHFSQPPAARLLLVRSGVYLNRESLRYQTLMEVVNIAVVMLNTFTHLHLFSFTDLLFRIGWRRQPHVLEGDLSFRLPAKNCKNKYNADQLLF